MLNKEINPVVKLAGSLLHLFERLTSDKDKTLSITIDNSALVIMDTVTNRSLRFISAGYVGGWTRVTMLDAWKFVSHQEFKVSDLQGIEDHIIKTFDL